jgi:hypothetical protein
MAFQVRTFTPRNFVEQRRELVWNWAQILKAIQDSYDPNFNPKDFRDLPAVCVVPPREANGRQLQCGEDPNAIQDPAARAAYIGALRLNDAKNRRVGYWSQLSRLDDEAMGSLEVRLELLREVAPAGMPSDAATIDRVLQKAGLSDARRKEIDPFI